MNPEEEFVRATEEFNRRVLELGLGDISDYRWYHTVDLGEGLVTPGLYDFRAALPCFPFPADMRGMRVLDVGSATGFFAFEFEKRGARVISVELPSLHALDRFPGQTVEQSVEKIERMGGFTRKYTAAELYVCLLKGPFDFCRKRLGSRVERCYSTVYALSSEKLGFEGFDLIFMGDILLHTLHPLEALAAVTPLCRGALVVSQLMADGGEPAMLYVGGDSMNSDEVSWWHPNKACLIQLLKKLGFRQVCEVGRHTGTLSRSGYVYDRAILRAVK